MLFKDIWTLLIFLSLKYPIQQMRRLSPTVDSVDPHVHQIISCALLSDNHHGDDQIISCTLLPDNQYCDDHIISCTLLPDNHHCDDQIICDTSELGRRTKLTARATKSSPVKEWR